MVAVRPDGARLSLSQRQPHADRGACSGCASRRAGGALGFADVALSYSSPGACEALDKSPHLLPRWFPDQQPSVVYNLQGPLKKRLCLLGGRGCIPAFLQARR